MLSIKPDLTVDQIRMVLEETSEDQVGDMDDVEGWDQFYGYGRINAFRALTHSLMGVDTFKYENGNVLTYPNPIHSEEILTIDNLADGECQISIYNHLGQLVATENISVNNSNYSYKMPKIGSGTYVIKVYNKSFGITTISKLLEL